MGKIVNLIGKVFTIPLKNNGFSVGLIVRQDKNIALGFFFNKYFENDSLSISECIIDKKNICFIGLFGILGITKKEWRIVGDLPFFNKNDWEIPEFKMKDPLLEKVYWKIKYDDNLNEEKRIKINEKEAKKLWNGGIHGYGLIEEIIMEKIIRIIK